MYNNISLFQKGICCCCYYYYYNYGDNTMWITVTNEKCVSKEITYRLNQGIASYCSLDRFLLFWSLYRNTPIMVYKTFCILVWRGEKFCLFLYFHSPICLHGWHDL
jgi:hypothetical protein